MTLGRLGILTLTLALVGYLGLHVRELLAAPSLTLYSPVQGLTTSAKAIEIQGKTSPGATVEINGAPLPPPPSGEFKHLLVLKRGINTITISAKKRYSRTAEIVRQILILEGGPISTLEHNGI